MRPPLPTPAFRRATATTGVLALALTAAAAPAGAATGAFVADGLTVPSGLVVLGTDVWVADHMFGFCRVDGTEVNQDTCVTGPVSPGQPATDGTTVWVPDNSSGGGGLVHRFAYDPVSRTLGSPASFDVDGPGPSSRPTALALVDGRLFVGSIRDGNIRRVADPYTTASTVSVSTAATTTDGGGVAGLTSIGDTLYVAETAALSEVPGAPSATGGAAQALPGTLVQMPTAIAADAATGALFVTDVAPDLTSGVLRYRLGATPAENAQDLFMSTGTLAGGAVSPLSSASALAVSGADLLVADDPGVAQNESIFFGRLFRASTTDAPDALGTPTDPQGLPVSEGVHNGVTEVFADRVTSPSGGAVLGDDVWVADHLFGVCRLAPQTSTPHRVDQGTCLRAADGGEFGASSALVVDPTRSDAATDTVYVIGTSTAGGEGLYRATYDVAARTLGGLTRVASAAQLGAARPNSLALWRGQLFVGFTQAARISAVDLTVSPAAVRQLGRTSDGGGVAGLAVARDALYLAEGEGLARIPLTTACAAPCAATAVATSVTAPTALAGTNSDTLYVVDTPASASLVVEVKVAEDGSVTEVPFASAGGTPPSLFRFASAVWVGNRGDGTADLYTGDDPSEGVQIIRGRIFRTAGVATPLADPPLPVPTEAPSTPDLAVASDSGVSSTDDLTNDSTPTLTGTAPAGAVVTVRDGGTAVGSATATSTGTYSVTTAVLADGAHQLSATAQVPGQLVSPASGALTVTVDTVAPVATVSTSLSADGPVAENAATVVTTWAAEPGATYRVERQRGTGAFASLYGTAGTTGTVREDSLAAARWTYRVTPTDRAGNTGAAATSVATLLFRQETTASPTLAYGGAWVTDNSQAASMGTGVRHASANGRTATLRFTGRQVQWVSSLGPNRGRAQVLVDGAAVETVDLYAAATTARHVAHTSTVSPGSHTIQVRVLGTKRAASTGTRVDVDAFLVVS